MYPTAQINFSGLVSVIIPAYNPDADLLGKALASIYGQSYPNIEIIICDDGSAVSVEHIVVKNGLMVVNATIPVIFTHNACNQGIAAARNKAIRSANGQWLVWLDADDTLHNDCIAQLVLQSHGAKMVIGECVIDEAGKNIRRVPAPYFERAGKYVGTPKDPFLLSVISLQPQMILKETFEQIGEFDENYYYAELTELFLRFIALIGVEQVKLAKEAVYFYNRNEPGTLTKNRKQLFKFRKMALLAYMKHMKIDGSDIVYAGRDEGTGMQNYVLRQ